jgi:type II pantothenate kinase
MDCGSQFGLDIGGSLCKVAVFVPARAVVNDSVLKVAYSLISNHASLTDLNFSEDKTLKVAGGRIYFLSFPSSKITKEKEKEKNALNLLNRQFSLSATGGGAHKFEHALIQATNAKGVNHVGEIQALFEGLEILLRFGDADEVFVLKDVRFAGMVGKERERITTEPLQPPLSVRSKQRAEGFLVVNIGSGVSFVDCDGLGTYTRVGGSSLGGATFLGLAKMLCGVNDFDEALDLASRGDSTAVDLLVGDIYSDTGESNKRLEDLGLRSSTLAASFGKLATSDEARKNATKEDLALACLIMIALNLAAMAHLHAVSKNRRVVLFVGSFLGSITYRRNTLAFRTLTYGIEFWGQLKGIPMRAAFLKREGFLGALGALGRSEGDSADVFKANNVTAKM